MGDSRFADWRGINQSDLPKFMIPYLFYLNQMQYVYDYGSKSSEEVFFLNFVEGLTMFTI